MNLYLAKVICEPGYYIANYDLKTQLVYSGILSFSRLECEDWVKRKKVQKRVRTSRISKINWDNLKTVWLAPDRKELVLWAELPGNLFNDFKPIGISLHIRDDELTPELEAKAKLYRKGN